ncbi:MAG: hypothetical protein R3D85_07240 [Paracoccaceae bacterium]
MGDALASLARTSGGTAVARPLTETEADAAAAPDAGAEPAALPVFDPWPEDDFQTPVPTAPAPEAEHETWPEDDFSAPPAGDAGPCGRPGRSSRRQRKSPSSTPGPTRISTPPLQAEPEEPAHAAWPEDDHAAPPPADESSRAQWPEAELEYLDAAPTPRTGIRRQPAEDLTASEALDETAEDALQDLPPEPNPSWNRHSSRNPNPSL